ncbi:MAG: D-alanine--D-alanine ligase [Oscillospiraceae bacterium]|nr:D-alanine--D-alanine ligase [Oscillospiraceae bacterium]
MKKNLCVIFGGESPEHDISQKSVTSVLNNLDSEKYNIYTLGITRDGRWFLYTGDWSLIEPGDWENDAENLRSAFISPDSSQHGMIVCGDKPELIHIDVIFPVLHGEYGEDGTIQGLFELSHIPYVGMGVLASANGMDKTYSKLVFDAAGIPQAAWVVVNSTDNIAEKADEIEEKLGYPCFVKPARLGSSVGIGKAHTQEELIAAIENAKKYDRRILVEEHIDGHEVECSVLGNSDPKASTVGEIKPTVEYYDFDAKYNDNSTVLVIPAELPEETINKIREYAVKAFRALDGQGLSRVDFFVKYSDGGIVLNEINTLPGFTNISMYPKLWAAVGLGYKELLDKLIELALERVK